MQRCGRAKLQKHLRESEVVVGLVCVTFGCDVIDALELHFHRAANGPLKVGKSNLELLKVQTAVANNFSFLL